MYCNYDRYFRVDFQLTRLPVVSDLQGMQYFLKVLCLFLDFVRTNSVRRHRELQVKQSRAGFFYNKGSNSEKET